MEHLPQVVVRINDLVVNDFAVFDHRDDVRIDETAVGLQVEGLIAREDLAVEIRVDVDGVGLDEVLPGLVIAFRARGGPGSR